MPSINYREVNQAAGAEPGRREGPSPDRPAGAAPWLTRADGWILGLALLAGVLLWGVLLTGRGLGNEVLIESGGRLYARAHLDHPAHYAIPGPLGVTRLEIRDGRARIIASPCPEQRCVHSGAIQRRGSLIVCVPNRVVVRIADGGNPLDMVTE